MTRIRIWLLNLLAAAPLLCGTADETLILGATVLTISHGTLPHADILVRGGRIAAVGQDLRTTGRVIEAQGRFVMPGIVDCHSHIAVEGDINEGSLAVTSMVDVGRLLNPEDKAIYWDLAGGVTTANILHGSSNPIGGQNVVIKLRWGQDAEGLRFKGAPPGIKFALGENPKRAGGRHTRYPATRMGVMDVIRQAFVDAVAYRKAWEDYRRQAASGAAGAVAPAIDLRLEPLVEALEGRRLVHAHCYRAEEIVQLMDLAETFGFRVATLQHVLEGYKITPEIVRHGAGGSTFSDWWAYKTEAYDATPWNAAAMARAGITVSLNSDDAEQARHLNQEAAKVVRYGGMSEDEALAMITLNPARQLGIADRVGSIDVGKDADMVIYDRDPLSVYAVAQQVLIDGEVRFDRAQDLAARAGVEAEKETLKARQKARAAKGGDSRTPPRPGEDTGAGFIEDQGDGHDDDRR
jgi:imidazolonepropionase-like amidohydrolase